jgi:hypothetical protein
MGSEPFEVCPRSQAAVGVESNTSWPCGQDFRPEPGCHQRRGLRHEARGLGYRVLTAGPVSYFYGVIPPARWFRPYLMNARGFYALFFRADPDRGTEGLETMTRTEHSRAARRRGELTRDRGSLRLSPAIDAQRRLNTRRAAGPGPKQTRSVRATPRART